MPHPTVPIGPNTNLTTITAYAIGFPLAIGGAYLLEFLDNTIKNPKDIEQVTGLPTLAGIARQELCEEEARERNLITIQHSRSHEILPEGGKLIENNLAPKRKQPLTDIRPEGKL
jgi:hypothetical protein